MAVTENLRIILKFEKKVSNTRGVDPLYLQTNEDRGLLTGTGDEVPAAKPESRLKSGCENEQF